MGLGTARFRFLHIHVTHDIRTSFRDSEDRQPDFYSILATLNEEIIFFDASVPRYAIAGMPSFKSQYPSLNVSPDRVEKCRYHLRSGKVSS